MRIDLHETGISIANFVSNLLNSKKSNLIILSLKYAWNKGRPFHDVTLAKDLSLVSKFTPAVGVNDESSSKVSLAWNYEVRWVVPSQRVEINELSFMLSVDLGLEGVDFDNVEEASVVILVCAVNSNQSSICIHLKIERWERISKI